jgi:hypothetical protein
MEQIVENKEAEKIPLPEKAGLPKSKSLIFVFLGVGILTLLLVFLFLVFNKSRSATISGTINYTALKPDPGDRGQVQIKTRKYNTTGNYTVVFASALAQNSAWAWDKAVPRQPYEIVADLVIDGKSITSSEPLIITAPAKNQKLNLHVTWHNLPESVVKDQTTYIKGAVAVNGYIPAASKILIQAKLPNDNNNFQTVSTIENAGPKNEWNWSKAIPLKDYLIKAILMNGITTLATSETMVAAGGDNEINFTLNSSAPLPTNSPVSPSSKTPTPSRPIVAGSITGIVFINGPEDINTSLLMLWRNPGDKNYQTITRINNPSHNGQAWNWNNLSVGKRYEITAVLQVNEQNTASTNRKLSLPLLKMLILPLTPVFLFRHLAGV